MRVLAVQKQAGTSKKAIGGTCFLWSIGTMFIKHLQIVIPCTASQKAHGWLLLVLPATMHANCFPQCPGKVVNGGVKPFTQLSSCLIVFSTRDEGAKHQSYHATIEENCFVKLRETIKIQKDKCRFCVQGSHGHTCWCYFDQC